MTIQTVNAAHPIHSATSGQLTIPDITPDMDTLAAALAYAAAGWYVLPVERGSKNPGSVVGKDWQTKSSRDPKVLASWFAGTDYGIALHVGRSGAVVADIDKPQHVPDVLTAAITSTSPPIQSTRADEPRRGHAIFQQPAGRMIGNGTGRLGGTWGEIRGRNGVIIAAPSEHQDAENGGQYKWLQRGPVPVLPESIAVLLDDGYDAADAATDAQVAAFLAEHRDNTRPDLLGILSATFSRKVTAGESRHGCMVSTCAGVMKEARAGYTDATTAAAALQELFLRVATAEPVPGGSQGPARTLAAARSEWQGILSWAVAQAQAADLADVHARVDEHVAVLTLVDGTRSSVTVDDVLTAVRLLHHVVDDGPIRFALAVAVSNVLDEEPLWGMNVGAPSSGKTVTQELLAGIADDQVDELTVAGLLTWSKGGKRGVPARPVGLLPRIGERGFATIGDFSTILAGSDHNGRDQLFGDLRRVYDGRFSRNMDSPDGKPLRWAGRLTLLAAVTPEIDRYSSHTDSLGPRWLYIRTEPAATGDKRAAARKARRRGQAPEQRKIIRTAAAALVEQARSLVSDVDLSDTAHDAIDNAALVACWGRASVPRQKFGRRDVDGVAVVEEPPRLVRQLVTLARCLAAMGDSEAQAVDLARRCALDTVPAARRDSLTFLADGVEATVSDISRATRHHRDVIRRALEDLQIIGLTTCPVRENADADRDDDLAYRTTVPAMWKLNADDGRLAMLVISDHRRAQRQSRQTAVGLPQEVGSTPPNPQSKGKPLHEQPTSRGKLEQTPNGSIMARSRQHQS